MSRIWILFVIPLSFISVLRASTDFSEFQSIEEVIAFESSQIATLSLPPEHLCDAYASRGESYFLLSRYAEALDDFQRAHALATTVQDQDSALSIYFRALFGQALVYGSLKEIELVFPIVEKLQQLITGIHCSNCLEDLHLSNTFDRCPIYLCAENVPIYGPDQMSEEGCLRAVENTRDAIALLIVKADTRVQPLLYFIVDKLAQEAKRCCTKGGLWKGCLQKICNKYHQWNQKWKQFNIPPDPAWDD